MTPSYVRLYVKRQKNDMADTEAICEAVMRPTMQFVETKTPEQQGVLGSEVLFSRRCHSQQFCASSSGSYRAQWFSGRRDLIAVQQIKLA
jgi:transposase